MLNGESYMRPFARREESSIKESTVLVIDKTSGIAASHEKIQGTVGLDLKVPFWMAGCGERKYFYKSGRDI